MYNAFYPTTHGKQGNYHKQDNEEYKDLLERLYIVRIVLVCLSCTFFKLR